MTAKICALLNLSFYLSLHLSIQDTSGIEEEVSMTAIICALLNHAAKFKAGPCSQIIWIWMFFLYWRIFKMCRIFNEFDVF